MHLDYSYIFKYNKAQKKQLSLRDSYSFNSSLLTQSYQFIYRFPLSKGSPSARGAAEFFEVKANKIKVAT